MSTVDLGNYFKIQDARDIYYNKYLNEGNKEFENFKEYSENTTQLSIDETITKLMK